MPVEKHLRQRKRPGSGGSGMFKVAVVLLVYVQDVYPVIGSDVMAIQDEPPLQPLELSTEPSYFSERGIQYRSLFTSLLQKFIP